MLGRSRRAGQSNRADTDGRAGSGYGDRGHKEAVGAANRVGRLLWTKGFGYNEYVEVSV